YNTRKLDELPFQYYHLCKDDPETFAFKPFFTQLDWVHDKLAATDCCHFLEDLALVHVDPLPEHIELLKEVSKRTQKRQREGFYAISEVVQDWTQIVYDPPVSTFYPVNEDFYKIAENKDKREQSSVEGFDTKTYDLIVRFDTRGKFVATVSTEREEICVWDVNE
ncbi:hypothetical protein ACJJTC_017539, partial [Scirpophaga incertulas]